MTKWPTGYDPHRDGPDYYIGIFTEKNRGKYNLPLDAVCYVSGDSLEEIARLAQKCLLNERHKVQWTGKDTFFTWVDEEVWEAVKLYHLDFRNSNNSFWAWSATTICKHDGTMEQYGSCPYL